MPAASVELVDEVDCDEWDSFVEGHSHGRLCHLSAWNAVLKASFAHMRGYYLIQRDASGKLHAGMPIYHVRSWLTGNRLVSIPFATLSDPLFSTTCEPSAFLDRALELQSALGCRSIEIRTLEAPLSIAEQHRFVRRAAFKHHYLELTSNPDQVMKQFSRVSVRQVRRALQSDLVTRLGENIEDLRQFHALYAGSRHRLGLPCQPYSFFEAMWEHFHARGRLRLLLAEAGNVPAAGLLLFVYKDRVSAEFGGYNLRFIDSCPNHLVYWESIRQACIEGRAIFDFGRTPTNNSGLLDFKRRWGTVEVDIPSYGYPGNGRYDINQARVSLRYRALRGLMRKSPRRGYELISRFCYAHLG